MNRLSSILFILLILFVSSCKENSEGKNSFKPVFSTYKIDSSGTAISVSRYEIHYDILTPVEICNITDRLGTRYEMALLNPVSNGDLYLSIPKTAINAGIYGADLGYLKMFGAGQQMKDYVITIKRLADKLDIPDKYISSSIKALKNDISEPDTIITLMKRAYTTMEQHLRKNNRESTASLIVLGGWVEAMYIATQVAYDPEKPDPEVIQEIAGQKYTFNSLLSLMKNYYDDPAVAYYTGKLTVLKHYFDSYEIYFRKGDLEIDSSRKILTATGSDMTITVETLNKIRDYISKLREEMITP
jgi:hypothetical protein